jgi:phosphoserine aminotransferase
MADTCDLMREVLDIPDTHDVLLMHGGAHAMFAGVAMNLGGEMGAKADYVGDGFWSKRAAGEASKYCAVRHVGLTSELGDIAIPHSSTWNVDPTAAFVHVTANETIDGLEYHVDPTMPEDAPPLVGDFTSTLLSRPVDFSKYGVVYASTGKNLGPSGLLVVIARKDLLTGEREMSICPGVMSWSAAAKSTPIQNIWNTPNVFGIRALQLVLEDCKAKGGVAAMRARATRRAWSVYDIIDASEGFYINDVEPEFRSTMTIPIKCKTPEIEKRFAEESEKAGFYNLRGHPLFGGLRVTMYNQLPDDAVEALVGFMQEFQMNSSVTSDSDEEVAMFGVNGKTAYASSPPSVLNAFAF